MINTLLKQRDTRKIRTLGGNPQQNGMVERPNGKLKIIISSYLALPLTHLPQFTPFSRYLASDCPADPR